MDSKPRGYFRMGVECTTGWPSTDQTVEFRGHRLTLCPETDDRAPSVVLRMDGRLTQAEARGVVQEFLSGLAWARGGRIVETMSIFSTAPVGIGKGRVRHVSDAPVDYMPDPADGKAKLALALYREAVSVNAIPYAFLGYFKVVNLMYDKGKDQKQWVNQALPKLMESRAVERLTTLTKAHSDVGKYLYESGRCAVAHAFGTPVVNPDDPEHVARLAEDLPLVKALAEYAIEHEIGIKSQRTVWDEHLYELSGFRDLVGPALVAELKGGANLDPSHLALPSTLSMRLRGEEVLPTFASMTVAVAGSEHGVVQLRLRTANHLLEAALLLDFKNERLMFDAMNGFVLTDDGSAAAARAGADLFRYLKRWMSNGETEVLDEASGAVLGRSQPTLLENVLPDWEAIDQRIAGLDEETHRRRASSAEPTRP